MVIRYWVLFVICVLYIGILYGCTQKSELQEAKRYARESEAAYQEAVARYKDLIAKTKNDESLSVALGKLYFDHGDFAQAAQTFKQAASPQAHKLLAISYYRSGNFVDALEAFNKHEIDDDEYLFYQGLTCEKLNLFDQSLALYRKIKDRSFAALAAERIEIIERTSQPAMIKNISPETSEILAKAPQESLYPQAGSLILSCDEQIEVTSDHKEISTFHYVIKILNERGKENFSEAKIDYDSTYEKVELVYARTIKADGTVVDVGTRHLRDVSKYLNFPLYSNARVFIISFPEVAQGAAVEYQVKVYRTKLINKKDFVIDYPVQTSDPIIRADFLLRFPKDNPVNLKVINDSYNTFGAKLSPLKEEQSGICTYRWQFNNIPQVIPESNMPPDAEVTTAMLISSFDTWQEVYDWWWSLAKDKMRSDPSIREKVLALTRGKMTEEEKARAIYNFCAKEIRYVAVEYGQAGYEPHFAGDVFKNKYGDCKDQAVLLVTMLKEAGISAWPVLIPTKDCYNLNDDFASMLFDHCIACVFLGNRMIFLDPTAETCSFGDLPSGDQNRRVLVCKDNGYAIETTPLFAAEHNLVKQRTALRINPDESIQAKKDIFTYGVYDQGQRYWLLYTQPQLIKEQLEEKIQDFCIGAQLLDYKIENLQDLNQPVVLEYSFKGGEYLTKAGPLRILPQLANIDTSLVAKSLRRYPVDFTILEGKETNLTIELPDGFSVKYLPVTVAQVSPWLDFTAQYSRKNRAIFFTQKTAFKKAVISQNEYKEFKQFFEGLAKDIKQRVVLEKVK